MKEIAIPEDTLKWAQDSLSTAGETLLHATALRVEASHRCFYRLHTPRRTLMLMESPPALERNEQFVTLARLFRARGLGVPEIIAANDSRGLYLLSDLGDVHLEDSYRSPARDAALRAAIDALPTLAAITDAAIPPYTAARLHMELEIYNEWFVQQLLAQQAPAEFEEVAGRLVESADMQPKCCVHRDYHCRNLLFREGQLGIVDFQDALHGPVLYDIASLLRDCYVEFSESEIERWLDYFVRQTPSLKSSTPAAVRRWFDWLAIQRQLKAIGIFTRLHLRDGKSTHLENILPLLERLRRLSRQYPELAPLHLHLNSCIKRAAPLLAKLVRQQA